MTGFLLARAVFVVTVVYSSTAIRPIAGHPLLSSLLGLGVALLIVAFEARLRDTAVTSLLGGLIGFGVGLWLSRTIVGALVWTEH